MDLGLKDKKNEIKKQIEDTRHILDIKEQLSGLNRRFFQMEKNFENVEENLKERDSKWDKDAKTSVDSLEILKTELDDMKSTISSNINLMESIIVRFKDSSKIDDYNQTMKALEKWKVESMVTKSKFKKLLLEEIEKRV